MVVQPGIQSAKDLKEKLLGIPSIGSLGHKITVRVLRKLGIDPDKEVRMIPVGGDSSRVQQLRGKQIDAMMINPPLSIMMSKEGFNLLLQARRAQTCKRDVFLKMSPIRCCMGDFESLNPR